MKTLAPIVTSDAFIFIVIACLVALSIWAGLKLYRASGQLTRSFKAARRLLGDDMDPIVFATRYEAASAELTQVPFLGRPWRGYRNSLVIPSQPGRPIVATADPHNWFDLVALFRDDGADLRLHAALPGILVGAGLMFTFLGLAAALSSAGDVVAAHSDEVRNGALQNLLSAASAKFVTSLFGLLLSLAYTLFRKRMLRQAEAAYEGFMTALLDRMPFRTGAALQFEANDILERSFAQMQVISNDFFVNLGQTLETKFSSGLEQHVGPLASAIEQLSQRLGSQNETAVGTMLERFMARMEGAVGDSLRGSTAALDQLGGRLTDMQQGLQVAAERMGTAAEEMATGLGRGTQSALDGITREIGGLVETMRAAAEQSGRSNRSAGDELARQMARSATGFSEAAAVFRHQLESGATESIDRLRGPLEAVLAEMQALGREQQQAGSNANAALAETVGRAASALEAAAGRIGGALDGGAAEASTRLVAATEAMRDDLHGVLVQFGATLAASSTAMTQGAEQGGRTLAGAASALGEDMAQMALRLKDAGEAAGTALRDGGATAGRGMTDAAAKLVAGGQEMTETAARIGGSAAALVQQMEAITTAMRTAALPLQAAAADLRAAATAAGGAIQPLIDAAGAVGGASDRLDRGAQAVAAAADGSTALAARLTVAAERFDGLDEAIGGAMRELGDGVSEIRRRVSEFVTQMDQGLAKSTDALAGIAQDLVNAVEDLADKRGKGP